VLWQDKDIIREEVYKVESSPLATESSKQAALHKISADLAEMIHMRIFEDF
jgi:hypothetical protein